MPKDVEAVRKDLMNKNPKMPKSLAYALATNMIKKKGKAKKGSESAYEKKMGHRVGSAAHKRMMSKKSGY